jgi:hypothetical protein
MSTRKTVFLIAAVSFFLFNTTASAQYCGDFICSPGEEWCTTDCSHCGDYLCTPELGENRYTCAQDCVCGDGICSYGEDSNYCPGDCPPPPTCTPDTCTSCGQPAFGSDADHDNVPDSLEYDLAHRFFPTIFLQGADYDINVSYLHRGLSIPYTVQPYVGAMCDEDRECLEIRYGIAYTYDFGDNQWWIRATVDPPHRGDSEFYAVLLQRTASWAIAGSDSTAWQLIRDFTAAHWGTTTDSSRMVSYGYCPPQCAGFAEAGCLSHSQCRWFAGFCTGSYYDCGYYWEQEPCQFSGCRWLPPGCFDNGEVHCYSTTPRTSRNVLYASERKHGLYHSDAECDSGAWSADECPSNIYDMRNDKEGKLQNVGSYQDHAAFDTSIQSPDLCTLYQVWDGAKFGESTPYRQHFTTAMNWNLPSAAETATPTPAPGSNPFSYASPRDQYLACYGIAGRISSNCRDISDFNDKQMCYAISDHTQSPCTQMTDRNLQLACYGMSIAPNYPSNCRDITDVNLQHFCYGVSGNDTSQCAAVADSNSRQLCYAMVTGSSYYCGTITNSNDRQFCYGVSTHINSYCASIG